MKQHRFVRAIRAQWLLVLLSGLVGVGVAGIVTWQTTPLYAAATELFVAIQGNDETQANDETVTAYQGGRSPSRVLPRTRNSSKGRSWLRG